MNRIPVPAGGAAVFEERSAASMRETLPVVAGLFGARLLRSVATGRPEPGRPREGDLVTLGE
ncbi:hypothetical protein [Streptomyces sp. NPDC090057]|uniref:hypothetical protein n=1 Tax=Streptomyces sp. NPDC090057 TaxID=3365935 RepID=UPI003819F957